MRKPYQYISGMKLFVLLFFVWSAASAQDQYITSSGDTIKIGDTIIIGPGSKPDGGYKYVDCFFTPGVGLIDTRMVVKSIKKKGATVWVKMHPGVGLVNYSANIEWALKTEEVRLWRQ